MFLYDMPLYRPPSEADSLILQVTLGCSFNRCSFCSMYRSKEFQVRPLDEVFAEIDFAARVDPGVRRVFLADGDAFVLETDRLLAIAERLRASFPELQRISAYAWPLNILRKSDAELERLRAAGLSLLYVGIESGSADLLRRITKGANPAMHARAIERARAAGIKISATVILGLGGRNHWREHVEGTASLVNEAPPNYLSTLQIGLAPEIADEFRRKFKDDYRPQDDLGMLREQRELIAAIAPPRPVVFRSNHASNALVLKGVLPRDRQALLRRLDAAIEGDLHLVPRWLRGY
ncbi:MAG: radical SAM protein [Planctomycetes bacterium]|nr:radical SAM protein [Planctomycetota bacterium]